MDNIYFIKHNKRTNPKKELKITIKIKKENPKFGKKILGEIYKIKFKSKLPDTTCIIYNNNKYNNSLLSSVYKTLIDYKLKRDQNVVHYAFNKYKKESKLKFFKWTELR